MQHCLKCQAAIPANAKFCLECGTRVPARNAGQEDGTAPVPTPAASFLEKPSRPETPGQSFIEKSSLIAGGAEPVASGVAFGERYELLEEIGRGGFAVVHKARDKKLGRFVAIKRLHIGKSEGTHAKQTLERFAREAQAIAGLSHRNIVTVFDHEQDAEGGYVVMEYVGGGSLREHLRARHGKLPVDEAVELVKGVARGLAFAHRKNLVHRDIKPGNILLATEEGQLVPKIVDFGLARVGTDSDLSLTGYGMGTPWYMPPEQRRNAKTVNHTADIYALGKTLYELVTGEPPDNVDQEAIPEPWLARVILRCIKNNPEDRYFSAEDLIKDLDERTIVKPAGKSPAVADNENRCLSCGTINALDAKYCEGCGAGLMMPCPECGKEGPRRIKFCTSCGTDVQAFERLRSALEGMRRYFGEKKWARVEKEWELTRELKFQPRGEHGRTLVKAAAQLQQEAGAAESRKQELGKEVRKLADNGQYPEAMAKLEELREFATNLGETEERLRQQLPERWAQTIETKVHSLVNQGAFELAQQTCEEINQVPQIATERVHLMRQQVLDAWAGRHEFQARQLLAKGQFEAAQQQLEEIQKLAGKLAPAHQQLHGEILEAWARKIETEAFACVRKSDLQLAGAAGEEFRQILAAYFSRALGICDQLKQVPGLAATRHRKLCGDVESAWALRLEEYAAAALTETPRPGPRLSLYHAVGGHNPELAIRLLDEATRVVGGQSLSRQALRQKAEVAMARRHARQLLEQGHHRAAAAKLAEIQGMAETVTDLQEQVLERWMAQVSQRIQERLGAQNLGGLPEEFAQLKIDLRAFGNQWELALPPICEAWTQPIEEIIQREFAAQHWQATQSLIQQTGADQWDDAVPAERRERISQITEACARHLRKTRLRVIGMTALVVVLAVVGYGLDQSLQKGKFTALMAEARNQYEANDFERALGTLGRARVLRWRDTAAVTKFKGEIEEMTRRQSAFDTSLAEANKQFGQTDYTKAMVSVQKALQLQWKNPQAALQLSNAIVSRDKQGQYERTLADAKTAFQQGRYQAAMQRARAALVLGGETGADAKTVVANITSEWTAKFDAALADCRQALKAGQFNEARQALHRAETLQAPPGRDTGTLAQEIEWTEKQTTYSSAVKAAEAALAQGDYQAVGRHLQKASASGWTNQTVAEDLGRQTAAGVKQALEKALTAARLAAQSGQWAEALKQINVVIELQPDHAEAKNLKASFEKRALFASTLEKARLAAARKQWAEAYRLAETAAQMDVADPMAKALKGELDAASPFPRANRSWTNTLGMAFVPVPGTKVIGCIWETRVMDYRAYAGAMPGVDDSWRKVEFEGTLVSNGTNHPVTMVSWDDAKAFCRWLTEKETREGILEAGQEYRLPTDAEWSYAIGLGERERGATPKDKDGKLKDVYPWGTGWPPPYGAGNYADVSAKRKFSDWPIIKGYDDGFATTAPVGSFKTNQFGLYDLSGNVCEWCEDFFDGQSGFRVLRGGAWDSVVPNHLLSAARTPGTQSLRGANAGFRCVLVGSRP
ncbi:MAG: protein kinase [Verrucomicrobiota bacterium]